MIEKFYTLEQQTKINLSMEVFGGTWDGLETGRADLVIGASGQSPNNQFRVEPLGILERMLAVVPNHPLAKAKKPICEDELTQYRAVSMTDTSRFFKPKHAPHLKMQPILSVADMAQKVLAQEMGLGIEFLPTNVALAAQKRGSLVIKEVETSSSPMLQYIYRKGPQGKALQWFVAELKTKKWVNALLDK